MIRELAPRGRRRSWWGAAAAGVLLAASAGAANAQMAAVGTGVLSTAHAGVAVAELTVASPPVRGFDVYGIGSWQYTDAHPTVILALEHPFFFPKQLIVSPAAGAIGFPTGYTPHLMANVTVIALLPVKRMTFNTILATQPLDDFSWSIVTKLVFMVLP